MGTIPRATGPRRPEDWLTSPGAFGSPESTRRHGLARSPTPRELISKMGSGQGREWRAGDGAPTSGADCPVDAWNSASLLAMLLVDDPPMADGSLWCPAASRDEGV